MQRLPQGASTKGPAEMFPGHASTLAVTDPELIEVVDNFAFDEVLPFIGYPRTLNGLNAVNEIAPPGE